MKEGVSGQQAATQPSERCLTRTAPSGGPTAARVPSRHGPHVLCHLENATIALGPQQAIVLVILKRHMGYVVDHESLWHFLYERRPFRYPASKANVRVFVSYLRRRLPPTWRIITVYGFGYILDYVG